MQTVFLKDGSQAILITQTPTGYVVNPLESYQGSDGEEYTEPSGNIKLVDKVYTAAPKEVIEAEYAAILAKVEEQERLLSAKTLELRKAQMNLTSIINTKTDVSRHIINREELRNAKRLILWPKDQIAPRIMDGTKSHQFTISVKITQYREEERMWCYELYSDDKDNSWTNSQYFDVKYGIKVDLTDDEIKALTHERIDGLKKANSSWPSTLLRTADEWLTPEYLEEKNAIKTNNKQNELEKAFKELQTAQEHYEALKNSLVVL